MIDSMTSARERIGKLDVAISVVASLLAVAYMIPQVGDDEIQASVAAVVLFPLVVVPLLWRRAAPLGALAGTIAAVAVHSALFGTDVIRCGVVIPLVFVLVFAAAARLDLREAIGGLVLAEACLVLMILTDGAEDIISALPFVLPLTAAVWLIGRVVHSRARMVAALRVRTAELRETRDERARLEVATDRARLSGELDELLHRRLGELAALADAGSRAGDAETATGTLTTIEHQGRDTLEQMRALVGALRDEGSDLPTAPQPTLIQLEGPLVRAKGAGARLTVEGSPRVLPAGVELSAYRVVEHLLAAVEDGPDVDLWVRFKDDAIEIVVSGPARRRASAAIEHARERVQLQRGTLQTTTRGGRAEAVATLPVLAGG